MATFNNTNMYDYGVSLLHDSRFVVSSTSQIVGTCPSGPVLVSQYPEIMLPKPSLTEVFIEKARKVHADKYDYSKVEYVKCNQKVVIICPEHGEFMQTPSMHLNGGECPLCSHFGKKNTDYFIKKSNDVHNNYYGYTKTNYVDSKTKVIVTCPKHGDFEILPNAHMNGIGCKECNPYRKMSFEDFVEKSRQRHGDKYEYPQSGFRSMSMAARIICPKHGEFMQSPVVHLSGVGCKKCWRKKYVED